MSPLSNNNNSTISENSSTNQHSSNSAFKPLLMSSSSSAAAAAAAAAAADVANRQQQQLQPQQLQPIISTSMASASEQHQYNSEMAYASYSTQLNSAQDYHNSQQQLPLGVFKREHDELSGYTYPRPVKLYEHSMEPYGPNPNGYRNDAPSPGASIIDLSTSSVVTSLRSHQGFNSAAYFDAQRYDRSPQSASSPHYSSPQMLSPQGQTLDLSVGRVG